MKANFGILPDLKERVKKKDIKDGSIVLMHPTYATTQCLDDIIQIIRDKGLKPGMLSNIF